VNVGVHRHMIFEETVIFGGRFLRDPLDAAVTP
jgi:hypothetical protein